MYYPYKIMKINKIVFVSSLVILLQFSCSNKTEYKEFSGIYPHLAYYNGDGECGTGAVVPWADRLWVVTYSPHRPYGSDDKLYEITPDLDIIVRHESIGGTPANRMIHKESDQLFIGPYVIDDDRNIRTLSYKTIPGRHTGLARHLSDPKNRILLATMEAGFYDIDVKSLEPKTLYKDGNILMKEGVSDRYSSLLPGYHGKGFYSGQGVAVYSNNGEEGELAKKKFDIPSGSLSEWDGKKWKVIRRNQFTEVTGPGGIYGNDNQDDPIWSIGWDYKSVILAVRESEKGWSYYRLPKASYSYDGAHGWNTEWPRIRKVGREYLMTMHGMFWHFPETFTTSNSSGIYPRGSYLKVIGDFCEWNNKLVFGCDDSAKNPFLNSRGKHNTNSSQSNSNLWFTSLDKPDNVGPTNASGSLWLNDTVSKSTPSDPFIFNGWKYRYAWIANRSMNQARIFFEIDEDGNNNWKAFKEVAMEPLSSTCINFDEKDDGVWIRAYSSSDIIADLVFSYAQEDSRNTKPDIIFNGINTISEIDVYNKINNIYTYSDINVNGNNRYSIYEVLLHGLGDNRRALGVLNTTSGKYYELDSTMNLSEKNDTSISRYISENLNLESDTVSIDGNSILVIDSKGRRWRLPYGDKKYLNSKLRVSREVVTERTLLSLFGTFFEVPAENADGYAKIRPISTSKFAITDFTSYRGMLILSGVKPKNPSNNPHIITSDDGEVALWAGVVDDLWKIGKPVGEGGPWYNSIVESNVPSDPYLIGFYDDRSLAIYHDSKEKVKFNLEIDPSGDGHWFKYIELEVLPERVLNFEFPKGFDARWIRIVPQKDVIATATFFYK